MDKKEILETIVTDFFNQEIANIKPSENGYKTISWGEYSQKIGKSFKENNIPYESLFDVGYCDNMDKKDPFTKRYTERCKLTPSKDFLKNILSRDFQKKILTDTISIIDWSNNIFEVTKNSSIIHIFRDFNQIGINHQLVNNEVTNIVEKHSFKTNIHANIIIAYIYDKFFFDEQFIEKRFKPIYNKTFTTSPNGLKDLEKIININKENEIRFNFEQLNQDLETKETKQKKIKI